MDYLIDYSAFKGLILKKEFLQQFNVSYISAGTLDYTGKYSDIVKKQQYCYFPLFPQFYDYQNISFNSTIIRFKSQEMEIVMDKKMLNFNYKDIQKLHIIELQEETEMYFQLKIPLACLQQSNDKYYNKCGSYFNVVRFGQQILQEETKFYLNYWNKNQVIYLKFQISNEELEKLLIMIKNESYLTKIFRNNNILHLEKDGKLKSYSHKVMKIVQPSNDQIQERNQTLIINIVNIIKKLKKIHLTIQQSIFALIANNRIHFDNFDQLNQLIDIILLQPENLIQNSEKEDNNLKMEYNAYIVDRLVYSKFLIARDYSYNLQIDIVQIYQNERRKWYNIHQFDLIMANQNMLRERNLYITPTIYYFMPAIFQESNKVVRMNKENSFSNKFNEPIHILRINFVNEYLSRDQYFGLRNQQLILPIEEILIKGINILDKKFQFLSYSNSQLKNHSCWFQSGIDNSDSIIEIFGDFSQEKNIFKMFARKGQCFTTTKKIEDVQAEDVEIIDDIERNNYNFTDGCGQISQNYYKQLCQHPSISKEFSAIQIRILGAKGMLSVNQSDQQSQSNSAKIFLRRSQVKFNSNNYSFEICGISGFSQGYFNKQHIILLNCLGVPQDYFLDVQKQVKEYSNIQSYKSFMLKIMKEDQQYHDNSTELSYYMQGLKFFQSTYQLAIIKNFDFMNDPILYQTFKSKEIQTIMKINFKQRFLFPDSCTLYGIVDDQGILEENEVFVQIQRDIKTQRDEINCSKLQNIRTYLNQKFVLQQRVLVTKSPSTHPGDIRSLMCVQHEAFMHLSNVIVFSSKGSRPQCNMMSNGDLDGDKYLIIWNQDILSYVTPDKIFKPCMQKNMDEFVDCLEGKQTIDKVFSFYLQRDILGALANFWIKLCQLCGQDGPKNELCLQISDYHQIAVDFGKHGQCVKTSKFSFDVMRVIEKKINQNQSQNQKQLLNQLKNDDNLQSIYNDYIHQDWTYSIQQEYELDTNILQYVIENKYNFQSFDYLKLTFQLIVEPLTEAIKSLMKQYKICFEGEFFSTDLNFRINKQNCHHSFRKNQNSFNFLENCDKEAMNNCNKTLKQIIKKYQGLKQDLIDQSKQDPQAIQNIGIAIYIVSYMYSKENLKNKLDQNDLFAKLQNINKFQEFLVIYNDQHQNKNLLQNMPKKLQKLDMLSYDNLLADNEYLYDLSQRNKYLKFKTYKSELNLAEQGEDDSIQRIINAKKLFSIPWLIGNDILNDYPYKHI